MNIKKHKIKQYNIYSVLNSTYIKFGKIFLESLHKNLDLSRIKNIYISDTGLNKNHIDYLSKFEKVKLINSGIVTGDATLWGNEWVKNVSSKTMILNQIVKENKIPTVMIDIDVMFVNDFYHLLDDNYDIQVCFRENSKVSNLGSFVSINNQKNGIYFIENWIKKINQWKTVPKESPALTEMVSEYKDKIKIQNILDKKISAYCDSQEMVDWKSHIVHFKSRKLYDSFEEGFEDRVIIRGFYEYVKEYIKE